MKNNCLDVTSAEALASDGNMASPRQFEGWKVLDTIWMLIAICAVILLLMEISTRWFSSARPPSRAVEQMLVGRWHDATETAMYYEFGNDHVVRTTQRGFDRMADIHTESWDVIHGNKLVRRQSGVKEPYTQTIARLDAQSLKLQGPEDYQTKELERVIPVPAANQVALERAVADELEAPSRRYRLIIAVAIAIFLSRMLYEGLATNEDEGVALLAYFVLVVATVAGLLYTAMLFGNLAALPTAALFLAIPAFLAWTFVGFLARNGHGRAALLSSVLLFIIFACLFCWYKIDWVAAPIIAFIALGVIGVLAMIFTAVKRGNFLGAVVGYLFLGRRGD